MFDTISTMDGGELANVAAAAANAAAGRGPLGGPAAAPRPGAAGGGSDDSEAGAVSAALGNLNLGPAGVTAASDGLGGASGAEQRLIVCIDDDDVNQVRRPPAVCLGWELVGSL